MVDGGWMTLDRDPNRGWLGGACRGSKDLAVTLSGTVSVLEIG